MNAGQFGKYRLLERIAVGGTAEVFRAVALLPEGERSVVLKRVLPQHARDPRFSRLFREEALVVARLRHQNVVSLVDFGELQGTFFLALEYVDGMDLSTLLHETRGQESGLDPTLAAQIAADVAAALHYIHTQTSSTGLPLRMVHRDVSPQNILVSRAGEVKLADFGIAQSVIRADKTVDGTIKGKLTYMSPEQARGERELPPQTDIFALGSVLYEMLFGQPPFRGETDVETLERVRQGTCVVHDSRLPPACRPLAAIVRRCLQPEVDARYPSADALRGELLAFVEAAPPAGRDLGQLVAHLRAARGHDAVDQLASSLLGRSQARGTAVLADRGPAADRPTAPLREAAAAPPPRSPLRQRAIGALLLLGAVTLTAAITFRLARAPESVNEETRSPAPSPTGAESPPDGSAAHTATAPDRGLAPSAPRLRLLSQPARAQVLLDGALVGRTPLTITAPNAPFVLEARRRGYVHWRRRLESPREDTTVRIKLSRRPKSHGRLTINSIPWTTVFIDGKAVGTTPIRGLKVATGRHRVTLKDSSGRVLRRFTTRVAKNGTRVHSFDLSR